MARVGWQLLGGLAILVAACGDGSSSQSPVPGSCAALGDPAVRCRFVGEWHVGESSRAVWVRVGAGLPGYFGMTFGPRGRATYYRLDEGTGAGATEFSGRMRLLASFADLPFSAEVHAELIDAGLGLRVSFGPGELIGGSTIEARYVGDR
ncbi:MAG: hypothetical protein SF182_15265 [Deltaproteobacteria bacterium]|nr:hypothetical protein [Deltaproteobacteria bacterium]